MTSLTQWTWVWVSSRSWWWRGKPGVLQSMGSKRVRRNWGTEVNWSYDQPRQRIKKQRHHFAILPPKCHDATLPSKDHIVKAMVFLVAQMVKHSPGLLETWVWSLGLEDPLDKEMATHSSILVWRISWTEEPGGLQSMGLQRVIHDWATNTNIWFFQ